MFSDGYLDYKTSQTPVESSINTVQIEFYFAFLMKMNDNEIIMIRKPFFRKDLH